MNNILLDALPTEYEGVKVNTSFRIGIQLALLQEETDLTNRERAILSMQLLFGDEDGNVKQVPKNISECIRWFMTGWDHDRRVSSENQNKRLIDYDVDQFRIYADFLNIYGIDLNTADLHFWAFQGLLWNMPHERSSFLQCIEIRTKKPRKGASAEERKAISDGHKRYDLPQSKKEVTYTAEEEAKIDAFDKMREEALKRRRENEEILKTFGG